jgi:hypothetical protein
MLSRKMYNVDNCRAFVHTYTNSLGEKRVLCKVWVSDVERYLDCNNRKDAAKVLRRARSLGQKIEKTV